MKKQKTFTAYKFMPLQLKQCKECCKYKFIYHNDELLCRVKSVIENSELHCSKWDEFNDTLEGRFIFTSYHNVQYINELKSLKNQYKVCCLSKIYTNHAMWAFYASEFSGVAIEIDFSNDNKHIYCMKYPKKTREIPIDKEIDKYKLSKKLLLSKHRDWRHEKEIRILTTDQYYKLNGNGHRIAKVIMGNRIDEKHKNLLHDICDKQGVCIKTIGFNMENSEIFLKDI